MLKLILSLFSTPKAKASIKSLRANVYIKNYGATPFPSAYAHLKGVI